MSPMRKTLHYEPDELPGCSTPHIYYSGALLFRQIAQAKDRRHSRVLTPLCNRRLRCHPVRRV